MQPEWTPRKIDTIAHVDLIVTLHGKRVGIDVKGVGRKNRHDAEFDKVGRWMELRNVRGMRGSLFGQAKYMVVASPHGWLWVDRAEMMVETVLRYVENTWEHRQRGESVIVHVPFEYMLRHAVMIMPCQFVLSHYAKPSKA